MPHISIDVNIKENSVCGKETIGWNKKQNHDNKFHYKMHLALPLNKLLKLKEINKATTGGFCSL